MISEKYYFPKGLTLKSNVSETVISKVLPLKSIIFESVAFKTFIFALSSNTWAYTSEENSMEDASRIEKSIKSL